MSTAPAPIPFPSNLDAAPIVTLAGDIKRFSVGLQQQATGIIDTARYALATWQGKASEAFGAQAVRHADEMMRTAAAVDVAPEALLRYAASISDARSVHGEVSAMYDRYIRLLPESETIVHQLVAAQANAVSVANTAAQYCADTLRAVKQNVTTIPFGPALLWAGGTPLFDERGPMINGPMFNGPQMSASPVPQFPSRTTEPFDYVHAIHNGKYVYKGGLWATEIYEKWVHLNASHIEHLIETQGSNGGKAFLRRGREVLAWKPGAGLTATEGTLAQTTARLAQIEARLAKLTVVLRGANVVGAALSGVAQVADDWDKNYTPTERTTRAVASTVIEGGAAIAGFTVGMEIGAAIGVWFGGVGAIPGAAVGAIIGGALGIAGGWFAAKGGKALKERAFKDFPNTFGRPDATREVAR